jgi:hydrogenase expression/formation protein HypC
MCLGIPGRIVEIRQDEGLLMGTVDFGGARREVCLAFVEDQARVGDYAVVHAGFAISLVDEEEALRTLELLEDMGELDAAGDSGAPGESADLGASGESAGAGGPWGVRAGGNGKGSTEPEAE